MVCILGSVFFSFMGISLVNTNRHTFLLLINPNIIKTMLVSEGTLRLISTKVRDISCIIEGHIKQLLETEFIEGQLLVL